MRRSITAAWCIVSVLSACGDGDGNQIIYLDGSIGPAEAEIVSMDASTAPTPIPDDASVSPDATFTQVACVQVAGISALPLNVGVGGKIALEGYVSAAVPGLAYTWSATSGTFTDPSLTETSFICAKQGDFPVTFSLEKDGCPGSSASITVTCN